MSALQERDAALLEMSAYLTAMSAEAAAMYSRLAGLAVAHLAGDSEAVTARLDQLVADLARHSTRSLH